jgi:hypothetical protein
MKYCKIAYFKREKTMQKVKLILVLLGLILVVSFSQASAANYSLNAVNLWANTGLTVTATDTLCFSNSTANWSWGTSYTFGPGGDPVNDGFLYDEWIPNNLHGEMIGYIGTKTPTDFPRTFVQNEPGTFEIGVTPASGLKITGFAGTLWIGFNDDFATNATLDNYGTGYVDVNSCPAPIPGALLLFSSGIVGMMGIGIRRKSS